MLRQRDHNGSALISAILITAIVTILATALAISQRFLIHAAQTTVQSDQLYLALQGEEILSSFAIKKYETQWTHLNHPFFPLQNTLPHIEINHTQVSGYIAENQGKYNVNNLVYATNQPQFVVLLQTILPVLSKQTALNIAQSITDWETTGSQDAYYLSLHPAYRSSKQEMVNISELNLIAGMTPTIFHALAPFVTALPVAQVTPININSASAPVLLAVNPNLTLTQATALIDCRKQHGGFLQLSDFMKACAKPQGITDLSNITTQSQYFQITSTAAENHHRAVMKSLLTVHMGRNNQVQTRTIWQMI